MKINLSKHDIVGRSKNTLLDNNNIEFLGLKEMPLSYINTKDIQRNPKVIINEKYLESDKKRVIPYSSFDSNEIYLFNNNNEILPDITLKRIGSEYFFETTNQVEYNPLRFSVSLEIKKNLEYRNNTIFNIKIAVDERDENDDLFLSKKLIPAFIDKNKYGNCPSNIIINNGSKEEHNMSTQNPNDCDFVFIESDDGIYVKNTLDRIEDEIDEWLDNHTNVWISCKAYYSRIVELYSKVERTVINTNEGTKDVSTDDASGYNLYLKNNILFDNHTYTINCNPLNVFDTSIPFIDTERGEDEYEYFSDAILVIHKKNRGYIIVTPDWFLDRLEETDKMLYETLIQIYLKSYITTRTLNMWITDEPVDYFAYSKKKFGRCHNIITLNDLLMNTGIEIGNQYSISKVKTSTDYVSFLGINNKNELMFTKIGGEDNPRKKNNEISYYTTKHSIINYSDEDIFLLETPIETEITSTETGVYLTIKPVYSTSKRLRVDEEQTFKITNFATQYNIFVDKGSKFISNTFYVIPRTEIPEKGWDHVGTLLFELSNDITSNDTRIMGGGLPLDQPDDFDMLDIGHIYGKPYRLGSTYIIKLPKKASNFDKRIRKELDKHIAAGDEYVIHYNNE